MRFTVNQSIAELYKEQYGLRMRVVRNVPALNDSEVAKSRSELELPLDKKLIILQGSGNQYSAWCRRSS